jgi:undecaprenyl-diphosphatase
VDPYAQALVMGIVQGLTEFLPISSSGHLILLPSLLGWDDPFIESLAFSVMLHLGTLLALIGYFARDLLGLIPAAIGLVRERRIGDDPERRLVRNLALATLPAAVLGYLLNDLVESTVRQPLVVALLLVVGAGILWLADRTSRRTAGLDAISSRGAISIGIAQALALLPGVSRSGISIAMGLAIGLEREAAARFSFLMATPIIAGAGLFELRRLVAGGEVTGTELGVVAVGFLAALLSGLIAIRFMLGYLRRHGLGIFVAYRLVLAVIVVVSLGLG